MARTAHAREILLPHPGTFDRHAATAMVAAAAQAAEDAHRRQQAAALRASNAREVLAALNQLWTDLPTDPRPSLEDKIRAARTRKQEAEAEAGAADGKLTRLTQQHDEHTRDRDTAQQTLNQVAETRRLLAPAVTAEAALASAREQLPSPPPGGVRHQAAQRRTRQTQTSARREGRDRQRPGPRPPTPPRRRRRGPSRRRAFTRKRRAAAGGRRNHHPGPARKHRSGPARRGHRPPAAPTAQRCPQ